MIIARYITKDVAWSLLAVTGILLLIALSNRFATFLAKTVTGELPISLVCQLVWLYVPELLSFLIPLSLFLSILFSYGRMHADSEMTVLFSCGVSWAYLCRLTLMFSFAVMLLVGWLCLSVVPTMTSHRDNVVAKGEALAVVHSLLPGRFQTFGEGDLVFYLEDINSKTNTLKGVFIAEQPAQSGNNSGSGNNAGSGKSSGTGKSSGAWNLITASDAHVEKEEGTKDFYLVLNDGYRYQGRPGQADYTIVKFDEYGRAVKQENNTVADTLRSKTSGTLASSSSLEDIAELQWRLSIPLSVPILALLAIPLACVRPRYGRFAKFLPALILYIVYYNLFTLSKRWVASNVLSSYIGVWWVHLLFLMIAVMLLAKESGWWREFRARHGEVKYYEYSNSR